MTVAIENLSTLDLALLNDWQRDFPLVTRPFDVIAARYGHTSAAVQARYQHLMQCGALSRIGGIFGVGAGGSAMLCALAVPPDRLDAVAQQVNQFEYVNHNYAREHHWNLWFVVNGRDAGPEQVLAPGDELALFPPLAGGA